jgi:hypothetical protein
MRQTKDVEIDGRIYTLTQLPATVGRKTFIGLMNASSDLITLSVAGKSGGGGFTAKDLVSALLKVANDDLLDGLCKLFGEHTRLRGASENDRPLLIDLAFDNHFAGRYGTMLLWLAECLLFNYPDFLDEKKSEGLFRRIALMFGVAPPESPPGSTGTSGE